jgi:carbon storage regulator
MIVVCGCSASFSGEKESAMLVLSRQRDESITIGDKVVVTIVDIRGDKVRLGIEAPNEVPVHRKEVYEAIKKEGRGLSCRHEPRGTGTPLETS